MSIQHKEFYFIRHGQTDHHFGLYLDQIDIPLNTMGLQQAKEIESTISRLPIKSVCHSPLKRAIQTKDFITANHLVPHYEIKDLEECSSAIWQEMTFAGKKKVDNDSQKVKQFVRQANAGINQALQHDGPTLIVAHGGIHWAMCYLMNLTCTHNWIIDNCIPVHFTLDVAGIWKPRILKK